MSPKTRPPTTALTGADGPATFSLRSARRKPSSATTRISLALISIRQPVKIGRLSSCAMANRVRPIISLSVFWGSSKRSPSTCGSSGYSTGSKPLIVVRTLAQRIVACIRSPMAMSHGPPGSLRMISQSSLPGRTARPSSLNVAGSRVSMPSARSVQVRRSPSSQDSNRMPSKIGLVERTASARLTMERAVFSSLVSQIKRIFDNLHGVVAVYTFSSRSRRAVDNRDKCQKAIRGLPFLLWITLDKAQNNRRVYPQRCVQLGSVCPKGR